MHTGGKSVHVFFITAVNGGSPNTSAHHTSPDRRQGDVGWREGERRDILYDAAPWWLSLYSLLHLLVLIINKPQYSSRHKNNPRNKNLSLWITRFFFVNYKYVFLRIEFTLNSSWNQCSVLFFFVFEYCFSKNLSVLFGLWPVQNWHVKVISWGCTWSSCICLSYVTCAQVMHRSHTVWHDAACVCDVCVVVQDEMTSALATMRVDYDQVKIKDLDTSSNPLLNKRRKRAATSKGGGGGGGGASSLCNSQWDTWGIGRECVLEWYQWKIM